ncbi:MAG: amylo-alpha-1,6-glucosidase [Candidatus Krumholzibacteriia bacterium]
MSDARDIATAARRMAATTTGREPADGLSPHERAVGSGAMPATRVSAKGLRRFAFDPVQIRVAGTKCRDLSYASKREWLLTNGMGGYAMSTIVGLNTRRYHGLLVATVRGPAERAVVLSKMKETVHVPGASRSLDTSFYPGVVHPKGFELCEGFSLYPFPTFVYAGRRWRLQKRVDLVHGENTVVVSYTMLPMVLQRSGQKEKASDPAESRGAVSKAGGKGSAVTALEELRMRVRPLFAFRDEHALATKNDRIQRNFGVRSLEGRGSIVRCTPYPEWEPVYLVCREARFIEAPDWYKSVEYPQDRYRGQEFREDLWSYGYYEADLRVGDTVTVVCTLHPPETHGSNWSEEHEVERRVQVMASAPDETSFARRLTLAASQFVVRRERDVATVIAGYPWFAEHVRDTMIALPGLMLVTGRFREAKAILRAYARALERGLLPNRFPDATTRAEYGSVDATLWFYVAIFKYLQYTGDFDFVKTELRIPLLETIRYFEEGTRFGIRVDRDGLLRCGEPGLALTWMDARVGNRALTPRTGKPVEVNALWYNALKLMERLAERFSIPSDMARFARRAEEVEENFLPKFWNEKAGCLYDTVDGPGVDDAIRPNQILAVSLPFPLLDSESAESVVKVVGKRLLTPLGLRSLDPEHPEYRGAYEGDEEQRLEAYHQGTSWTWLLGPYISAWVKSRGGSTRGGGTRLLKAVEKHMLEDGLGQVSEITWGDPPHWPRGCIAHAAAVGEILRAYHEDLLGRNPGTRPGIAQPALRKR